MEIAFLDHSFHAHTKSSHFFVSILERLGRVDIFYINPERVNEEVAACKGLERYSLIVFWQIRPSIRTIRHLDANKVIFVPMYDGCCQVSISRWAKYRKYRFIAFSKLLHQTFLRVGISSFFLQYVPPIPTSALSVEKERQRTIYIWKRHKEFQLQPLIDCLHKMGIEKAICHETTEEDKKSRYPIEMEFTNGWYPTHEDYVHAISRCHYYLAPRLYEGIGMSFLEAMGCGLCVLSPNRATMNEYIVDGENGILFESYEELSRKQFDFEHIGQQARRSYLRVQEKWEAGEERLIAFLQEPPPIKVLPKLWWLYILQDKVNRRRLRRKKVEDFQ